MSRYSDPDWEDLSYELDNFLESHKPWELLKLVTDAIRFKEEE